MTPRVDTRPRPRSLTDRLRSSRVARLIIVVVVAAVLLADIDRAAFVDPTFVERISFVNDSGYDIHVAVAGDRDGRLGLGTVLQHCTTSFDLVVDQGDSWRIQFRAQGRDGGELQIARSQLEADGWTYRIPPLVPDRLRAAGAPPPQLQTCTP